MTPTQRTLIELRNLGREANIVERWIARSGVDKQGKAIIGFRKDLFGIVDVLCLDPSRGFVGVQSCGEAFSAHMKAMLDEKADACINWLKTPGGNLELWGWRKVKLKRGGKAMRWRPRIHVFTLEDFE